MTLHEINHLNAENAKLCKQIKDERRVSDNLADVSIGFLDIVKWVADDCPKDWLERMKADAKEQIKAYMSHDYFKGKRTLKVQLEAAQADLAEIDDWIRLNCGKDKLHEWQYRDEIKGKP